MALVLKDRVKETTIVTGTGTATLLGSSIGFQPFSVVGNGNTTYYCISDQFGSNWEVGLGTYSSSGNTLARTTVLASSNGGALVVFTAGVKDVFVTYPAEKGVWLDSSGNAIGLGTPAAFVATNVTGLPLSTGVTGTLPVANGGTGVTTSTGTGSTVLSASPTFTGTLNSANLAYTGTLTGGTGVVAIGTNQIYKDASGNVGIGTSSPGGKLHVTGGRSFFAASSEPFAVGVGYSAAGGAVYFGATDATAAPGVQISGATGSPLLNINSSGNVGIGTTVPNNKLTVGAPNGIVGTGTVASFSGVNVIASNTSGMVVITSTDSAAANIGGSIGFAATGTLAGYPTGSLAGRRENATAGDYSSYMQFTTCSSGGSVQEKMRISSTGIVTMSAYGVGTATFSAAGVISSVSDETWKIKDGVPVDADSMLKKLEPGYWYYNDEKKEIFGTDRQLGFYAQNVNAAIGTEAAPPPEEGKPWGYYDRSVLAVTVMSLQKALATIEALTARLTALEAK